MRNLENCTDYLSSADSDDLSSWSHQVFILRSRGGSTKGAGEKDITRQALRISPVVKGISFEHLQ